MLSENVRSFVYWTLDMLRGNPIRNQVIDIKKCMSLNNLDEIEKKTTDILNYAIANVPFYQRSTYKANLNEFPVVNKQIIKQNYNNFQSIEFKNSKVQIMKTSGSTGTPFEVRQDLNKRNRCLAEMMYFWGLVGYRIGQKYIFYRSWNEKNRKSKISAFSRNLIMRDVVCFDEKRLRQEREFLTKNKDVKMLLGYASTLEVLGNYLFEQKCNPDMFGIESIIAISEKLSETARAKLCTVFGCPVISHYSNSEMGVLGQWDDMEQGFVINQASVIIEIFDLHKDKPIENGELGRVIVTDLYNHAMPLIRYDTGDIAIMRTNKDGRKILERIDGRKIDIITNSDGIEISPHEISVLLWDFPEIKQYQFVEKEPGQYTISIVSNGFSRGNELIRRFRYLLGEHSYIHIEQVETIELAKSGKCRYIINLCNQ